MHLPHTLRLGCAAALIVLTASACGGLGSTSADSGKTGKSAAAAPELRPDQKAEIVFESYNLSQAGIWTDTINGLVKEFQDAHPNIKVTARPPQGGAQNVVGSLQSQLVVGKAPDVAQVTFGDLDFAVNGLKVKALDDLVGKPAVQAAFGGTHPFAPNARTLGDWNGKTYGMPYVFSTPVMFYNAEAFRAAGLDPDRPPSTWDEVKQAGLAIKAKTGKGGAYVDCATAPSGDWCLQAIVGSNGGSVISADRRQLTFAEAPAVSAVGTLADLVASGASPNLTQAQAIDAFSRGNLGMVLESSSLQGTFQQAAGAAKWELRAAALPAFAGKPTVPTNSGSALMVLADDPVKQRAAWEFITFMTSDRAYTQISSRIGYLPLRPSLVDDPAGLKPWADKNPLLAPNLAQLDRLRPWTSFPGNSYVQIRDLLMQAVEASVYQGKDPAATLGEARRRAEALLPK
ncbi:ABC transporter substrate-binding protein [Embleya sp. AB8]|uniref:ABC transporter substrate-binding protein n=1 Tax=Embleya sp. AB8 TaxID=3156304 RepID=UPI003C77212A